MSGVMNYIDPGSTYVTEQANKMLWNGQMYPTELVGTTSAYNPQQQDYLKYIMKMIQGSQAQGTGLEGGNQVSGASPLQSQTFGQIQNLLGGRGGLNASGGFTQGQDVLQQILASGGNPTDVNKVAPTYGMGVSALNDIMKPYDPTSAQDYWSKTFVDPALKTWRETVAPQISEQYTARNAQYSQALPNALAKSGGDLMTGLSGQLQDILYQGEQAQKARQVQGAGLGLDYAQLPTNLAESAAGRQQAGVSQGLGYGQTTLDQVLQAIQAGMAGGTTERGITESQQPYANPWLQYMMNPLGVEGQIPIIQQGSYRPGILEGMMGGMGQGAGSALATWALAA